MAKIHPDAPSMENKGRKEDHVLLSRSGDLYPENYQMPPDGDVLGQLPPNTSSHGIRRIYLPIHPLHERAGISYPI